MGLLAGAVMGLLTVTIGANQHVSGLGLTIVLVGLSEFGNRLLLTGSTRAAHRALRAAGTRCPDWARSGRSPNSTA